ncbi:MAG: sugar ABC transporter permease [Treponema sp.]|jgi:lactose/L-arabinose transport system permease protein|nr:sugar ABC transporter permease [Treponema sp.]
MKRILLSKKYARWGWIFVAPAALLIFVMSFYPMIQAFILSLQSGMGMNLRFSGMRNYFRLLQDEQFRNAVGNVFIYLIIQVPIMLFLALTLASVLNSKDLKGKAVFRSMIFLPCAMALVSSSLIFRSLFSIDGLVNFVLLKTNTVSSPVTFLTDPFWAKFVIILIITWRWTGYNTIFYLAGLQSIDTSIYESARIDGASSVQQFFRLTLPLLRPIILLTLIMSTNGTLQLFDEARIISPNGVKYTITISQHIYNLVFQNSTQLGYASAVSYSILVMVAVLAFIQMKIGDKKHE